MRSMSVIAIAACLIAYGMSVGSVAQEPVPLATSAAEARAADVKAERARILEEAARRGGFDAWKLSLEPYRTELRVVLKDMNSRPETRIRDFNGHLMHAFDISYVLADSFLKNGRAGSTDAPVKQFSLVVDFYEQLKRRGIDLIFIPVPVTTEMIPDVLASHAPEPGKSNAPQRSEYLLALLDAGVEVIDLYPGLYREQERNGDTLCLLDDTHWNQLGIKESARQIAERLSRYDFVSRASGTEKRYHTQIIQAERRGDLARGLPEAELAKYPPRLYTLEQVTDEQGVPYEDDEESPILIAGDSFTYLFADNHAGISAHIAKEIGMPVARMSSPRGGPSVPRTLARQGKDYIDKRRVVVWIMASRYLLNSRADDWQTATLP